jgi:hypothetical protein
MEVSAQWSKPNLVSTLLKKLGRRINSFGFVNLTRLRQTGQHEKANTQLPKSSLSLSNHQPRRIV